MPSCSSVGSSPDVDEAMTTDSSTAASARASSCCFTSSRSGALSCTNVAPSTASSGVATNVSVPSAGSGAASSRGQARRALATTSPTLRGASGSGS